MPHDSAPARAVLGGVIVTVFLVLLSFMGAFRPDHEPGPTTPGDDGEVVLPSTGNADDVVLPNDG